jgi:hypothetical protein
MHRAITSFMEEIEAVDWYNQRVDACKDPELKAILAHNQDEQKKHATIVLEWIQRRGKTLNKEFKDCLFIGKKSATSPECYSLMIPADDALQGLQGLRQGNETKRFDPARFFILRQKYY